MSKSVDFRAMRSLDEILDSLDGLGGAAVILAGGTDVMMQLRAGQIAPGVLLHVQDVPGLDAIAGNGRLSIGALVTHRTLATATDLNGRFDAISGAAAQVGGWQTQAVGTLAGNVANASPAADTVPALLVHDARVHLASARGDRELALADFLIGRRRTARRPEEFITRITVELPPDRTRDAFVKVGRRSAMEVAIVCVAVRLTLDDSGAVRDARIAVGAASEVPYRAAQAEELLAGERLTQDIVRAAAVEAARLADPIDDVRASRRYRLAVLPRAIERALQLSAGHVVNAGGQVA